MNLKENLGKNIQKYRKLSKITQEKLAEMVDIEINSISSIERGKYFPSPENLVKISQALNVSLSDLFLFKNEYSCEDYINEISKNIQFIKKDKTKLNAVNTFIKSLLTD
ncbi:MAG: helix-turn-helix domain-containing protein [Candidatus Gastranaerophilaceae bacterium]